VSETRAKGQGPLLASAASVRGERGGRGPQARSDPAAMNESPRSLRAQGPLPLSREIEQEPK